ncbi:M81 family metallopeptidase [Oceaniglobus ichthyenteri]|uniref:M81 family metallopeptidase n=1 Tax=Oceaniglobus ichthyenteri TaxID=2136177 RepID=UPI000D39AF73|nr:M81 family metallopeptidase [Oceaniglobus ichthyenteri]
MRFVAAMMRHETNTFSPIPTPLSGFFRGSWTGGPLYGADAVAGYRGTNYPLGAFIDGAEKVGADLSVPIAANASPSGVVDDAAFEHICELILDDIAKGCDAVLLDLHGAMVCESHDDAEGELVRRIRGVAPDVPIAVALDYHTNLSAELVENSTVITGYRTYPHVDMYETGERAMNTLMRAVQDGVDLVMMWDHRQMLTHMLHQTPAQQPMRDIMELAIAAENSGEVANASLFVGFPLADTPHTRMSAVVVAERAKADAAKGLMARLLDMAWDRRADFVFSIEPMSKSIEAARALEGGPVILVDHGDNTGAGGCQDGMAVIEEALRQGLDDMVAGPIFDPEAVAQMIAAGVGEEITIDIGGKVDMPALDLAGHPLRLSGTVTRITDGKFRVTGPMMTGIMIDLGRCVVLDTGPMQLVVCERRLETFDVGCFTHAGIDPTKKRFVLIKSRQHFRAGFEPIARHIVLVAGPGVCSSDYSAFPFQKLTRPIYPLDQDAPAQV